MNRETLSNLDVLPIAHSIVWSGSLIAAALIWSGASKHHWFVAVILGVAVISSASLHYYCHKQR